MTNQILMLNFARGKISIDEVVEGKKIIKPIYGNLNRVETISLVSENKKYIVTTEKIDNEVEKRRYYSFQEGKLSKGYPRLYNPLLNKFYN